MKRLLKNKLALVTVLMICILSLIHTVNAFSGSMSLTSSSKLKQGEIIEVSLKVTNLDAGDGIDTIVATLEYDNDIFDQVTKNSMVPSNDWNITSYSSESGILTIQRDEKVKSSIEVLKISFRVKESANTSETKISLKDITITGGAEEFGGTGDIELQPISVTIPKEDSSTEKPPVANEISNTITNDVEVNTITNNIATNTTTNTTTNRIVTNTNSGGTTGKLPQTGENAATYIAGISIVSAIAVIAFIKYRNINV